MSGHDDSVIRTVNVWLDDTTDPPMLIVAAIQAPGESKQWHLTIDQAILLRDQLSLLTRDDDATHSPVGDGGDERCQTCGCEWNDPASLHVLHDGTVVEVRSPFDSEPPLVRIMKPAT